ncbi:IclR family transcriptional regulator [Tenacibaculum sp. 190524A02b]|uniref:IclR family transcriptional regulator n=1 Tax=Tenacibaculum vairaonense TaxID=3137860 RepID=UPI0031FB31BE
MNELDKNINQSVKKAFTLLDAFTDEKKVWGVRELAQKTGYNKSTTYRLLNTLMHLNIVHQTYNDKYSLGSKLYELGNRVSIYKSIKALTHEPIKNVALEIQETVLLSVLKNNKVFHIDKADSLHGLKINTSIGSYEPIHATAAGKLLLSYLPFIEQENTINNLKLDTFTQNTLANKPKLKQELKKIQLQGYALDMEELESGLVCIAIPIRNKNNKVIASISASGPLSRFRVENINSYISILQKGATIIEKEVSNFDSL